jgi:hypothetical protein
MIITNASFGTLVANYPRRVQMSHALNSAGILIGRNSYRRTNSHLTELGWNYLLAVDEVEDFLTQRYGMGEDVKNSDEGTRGPAAIRSYLGGRTGILVFRQRGPHVVPPPGLFEHTELWDGAHFIQRDMAVDALLSSPRVLFWYTSNVPSWLSDAMGS